MIKGIYLETEPNMNKVSREEIMENLDFLKILGEPDVYNIDSDNKFERTVYYSDKYYIVVFKFVGKNMDYFKEGLKTYEILQKSCPELIISFKYSDNKIIYAYPRYDTREDTVYKLMLEELIRVASFLLHILSLGSGNNDESVVLEMVTESVKNYVGYVVSTPSKRNSNG